MGFFCSKESQVVLDKKKFKELVQKEEPESVRLFLKRTKVSKEDLLFSEDPEGRTPLHIVRYFFHFSGGDAVPRAHGC